jgi:hypothetical protein
LGCARDAVCCAKKNIVVTALLRIRTGQRRIATASLAALPLPAFDFVRRTRERTNLKRFKKGARIMAKKSSNPPSKVQPFEEIRIGAIKAAIWRNEGENGARFNVTFQRLYKTEQGQWQSTDSFAGNDLLLLAKVADATHTRVLQLIAEERQQNQTAA